jgi:type IV pilus assembly protein PilB
MDEVRRDFTKLLVEKGLITKEQLDEAHTLHADKGGSLSELLIQLGFVDERDLMIFLSTYLSIPPIKILNLKVPQEILKLIPKETAKKYMILPIGKIGNTLTVAVADPMNVLIFEDLERLTGLEINPVISSRSELQEAINNHYKESVTSAIEEIIKDSKKASIEIIKEEKEEVHDEEILRSIEDAPIIKLTNYLLKKAVEEKASDVLIEPMASNSRVRFRVDGLLHEAEVFPRKMHNFVISRVKVIANLDITEHRLSQDGRFRMNMMGKEVDFRVSILPSTLGEKVALRILDKSSCLLDVDVLGFEGDVNEKLKKDGFSSYGMILVCGPTGCGKTTTLYSILHHIYSPEKNIITVEDPIEYQLKGINQVNVNYDVNLTFSSALRSILRQDPDVIMVGEIRDFDTVDIGIKAALTGHLVLSTLHTTTASGSVTRLLNMGVEPFLLSSTLIGVLAQRLVRRLCPKCKEEDPLNDEIRKKFKISKKAVVYKAKGCRHCLNLGYKGRVALCEYLQLDSEIRRLINQAVSEHIIQQQARSKGMRTLRADGMVKVEQGLTSIEEVLRATSADEG